VRVIVRASIHYTLVHHFDCTHLLSQGIPHSSILGIARSVFTSYAVHTCIHTLSAKQVHTRFIIPNPLSILKLGHARVYLQNLLKLCLDFVLYALALHIQSIELHFVGLQILDRVRIPLRMRVFVFVFVFAFAFAFALCILFVCAFVFVFAFALCICILCVFVFVFALCICILFVFVFVFGCVCVFVLQHPWSHVCKCVIVFVCMRVWDVYVYLYYNILGHMCVSV
jgi:hypothetical protein